MKKTMLMLECWMDENRRYICIRDYSAKCNEYKIFYCWKDDTGKTHKSKIEEFADFESVLRWFIDNKPN